MTRASAKNAGVAALLLFQAACRESSRSLDAGTDTLIEKGDAFAHAPSPPPLIPPAAPLPSTSTTTIASVPSASKEPIAIGAGFVGRCKVTRGPLPLPFSGTSLLNPSTSEVTVVGNDDGVPLFFDSRDAGSPSGPSRVLRPRGLGCAFDGTSLFCPDAAGALHQLTRTGEAGHVVAETRSGTRIAAGHAESGEGVVAFIAESKGGERTLEAWTMTDGHPPERISEEGGGATDVTFVIDHDGLAALMLDGRMGMTALHRRRFRPGSHFQESADEVLFVAGPADRRTRITASSTAHAVAFATFAMSKGAIDFGELTVPLDLGTSKERQGVWSLYPNGLDPAPIAASRLGDRVVVARVRPATREPKSARILELGPLESDGTFTVWGTIPTHGNAVDVSLATAGSEPGAKPSEGLALWAAYSDVEGGWLTKLLCPE